MFTDLFLKTTNPSLSYINLFKLFPEIVASIVIHTTLYIISFNGIYYIFLGKFFTLIINTRIIGALIIIMFFGFIARLWHAKEIYKVYNNLERTKNHINHAYITWYFLS